MDFSKKIIPLSRMKETQFGTKEKTVLAGGCFDILHYGHLYFIQKARLAGDSLILLLESDEFIRNIKKKVPVHTQQQRAELLAALGYVTYVILLPPLDSPDVEYENIVKQIHPSIIAYTKGDSQEDHKKKYAEKVHADILLIPYLESFSSSQLITYAPIFRD
jgi:cytidyltransferase-like protein